VPTPVGSPTLPPQRIIFAGTAVALKLTANRPVVFALYALPVDPPAPSPGPKKGAKDGASPSPSPAAIGSELPASPSASGSPLPAASGTAGTPAAASAAPSAAGSP
jgi:hypothetical protein